MPSDSDLKRAVLDELSWEPSVNAAHLGVTAQDGVVTLTGHVDTYSQKFHAEKAAGRVKGVKGLAEEIEVKLPGDLKRTDAEIAAAAIDRLSWNATIPVDAIQVRVSSGWVTLAGSVTWNYEKEAAEEEVRNLFGVIGVSNQVLVRPGVRASNIEEKIDSAFRRSYFYDRNSIHVVVHGDKVTLTGKVTTWNAQQLAGATAWSAPGVSSVENQITVD